MFEFGLLLDEIEYTYMWLLETLLVNIGINHHQITIVFGFGLLSNETESTYTWFTIICRVDYAMNKK